MLWILAFLNAVMSTLIYFKNLSVFLVLLMSLSSSLIYLYRYIGFQKALRATQFQKQKGPKNQVFPGLVSIRIVWEAL